MICLETCRSSATSCVSREEEGARGERPDLEDSPDVLIWMRTLRGAVREEGRALFKAVAALVDVRV
jgi:hypothetical protein